MKKKIRLNWGWGIAVFYGGFLILAIGSAIYTSTLDYFLVSDNYYQEGIDYQQQIEKVQRTAAVGQNVQWTYNPVSQTVQFRYPENVSSGKIVFYRPSDSNLDRYVKIEKDAANSQSINVLYWQKGFWKIKVDWEMNGEEYYNEGSIDIK